MSSPSHDPDPESPSDRSDGKAETVLRAPAGSAAGLTTPKAPADADPNAAYDPRRRRMLRLILAPLVLFILLGLVFLLGTTLLPFIVAGLLAVVLAPLVDRLVAWHVPRPVAAALVTLAVTLLLAGVLAIVFPLVLRELSNLTTQLPDMLTDLYWWVRTRVGDTVDLPSQGELKEQITGMLMPAREYIGSLLSYGMGLFSGLLLVLITPFITAYLLADWPRMLRKAETLLPRRSAPTLSHMMRDMRTQLGAFIRGQLLIVAWQAVLHATGLFLLGLNFGLLIGIMTGLAALVPVIGNLTMFAVALITAVIQFDSLGPVFGVVLIYSVSQLLETTVLTPWLVGERVQLHPVWVIFALLIGGSLFGLAGALLAMPTAAVVRVLAAYTVQRYRSSRLYEEL